MPKSLQRKLKIIQPEKMLKSAKNNTNQKEDLSIPIAKAQIKTRETRPGSKAINLRKITLSKITNTHNKKLEVKEKKKADKITIKKDIQKIRLFNKRVSKNGKSKKPMGKAIKAAAQKTLHNKLPRLFSAQKKLSVKARKAAVSMPTDEKLKGILDVFQPAAASEKRIEVPAETNKKTTENINITVDDNRPRIIPNNVKYIQSSHAKKLFVELPEDKKFWLLDGRKISNLNELRNELEIMSESIFVHHVNDYRNDFSTWVKDVFDEKELAEIILPIRNRKDLIFALDRWIGCITRNTGSSSKDSKVDSGKLMAEAKPENIRIDEISPGKPAIEKNTEVTVPGMKDSTVSQSVFCHENKLVSIKDLLSKKKEELLAAKPITSDVEGTTRNATLILEIKQEKIPDKENLAGLENPAKPGQAISAAAGEPAEQKEPITLPPLPQVSRAEMTAADMIRRDKFVLKGKKIEPDHAFLSTVRKSLGIVSVEDSDLSKDRHESVNGDYFTFSKRSASELSSAKTLEKTKPENSTFSSLEKQRLTDTIFLLTEEISSLKSQLEAYDEKLRMDMILHKLDQHDSLIKEEDRKRIKALAKMKELEEEEIGLKLKRARIKEMENQVFQREEDIREQESLIRKKKSLLDNETSH
jgi:hypothetical protein